MNEDKEINELATEIYTLFRSRPMSRALARRLYDKGWRKQKEGEWVQQISKDKNGRCFHYAPSCSVCGYVDTEMTEFCPMCGAKMKGGAG